MRNTSAHGPEKLVNLRQIQVVHIIGCSSNRSTQGFRRLSLQVPAPCYSRPVQAELFH
jgi:hypothetical protein